MRGALIAHWELDAVGAPHVGERTEKELITAFCDKIAKLRPQLVTFNGNSFDLPVSRYRAMVHGVAAPGPSRLSAFQEAMPSGVGDHTLHFAFRNTAVERGGAFGRPSGFQNVLHHLIAHSLGPSRRRTFATFPYLIYGRRKRCPVHHLDRHQTLCAHDGGRAKQRGRRSNKKISAASRAKSGYIGVVVLITPSATEILRDLRKPQVRQGRPCGDSSRTRTHSGKTTT
jgi:Predicted 3'-5' exonuclease related to the exonuclease domain of PolB